jgi:hypothetical protein
VKGNFKMAHYKGAASEAGRAMHLMKKREKAQQEIEFRKKKIEEDLKISNIENKFAAHYDAVEQQLKVNVILNNFRVNETINKYAVLLVISLCTRNTENLFCLLLCLMFTDIGTAACKRTVQTTHICYQACLTILLT